MPGRTMKSGQPEGTISTPRSRGKASKSAVFQPPAFIKGENGEGDEDYDEDTYKPRPQLPKPFVVMRSLADLIKDLDAGLIDVNPEYQREIVWTADRMTGLVNSLMENFYIPPIILNKKTRSSSAKDVPDGVNVCVDGKQRLSSVRAFVQGMIPCHDHQGEKWYFCETSTSRRRKVLSEDEQRSFLAKEFVSFEFKDLSQEQEEDLFARVQLGVQLSLAEKMRASSGPWQELARLFVDDFPMVYSLMKDRARAKDFQLTLSCFSQIVEVRHPSAGDGVPTLKTGASSLQRLLQNKSAVDDKIKAHLASVWNTFKSLIEQDRDTFTNDNKYLRGVQTFAPVEMVAVAVLISMYSNTRNNQLLLGDIRQMRETIREHFADLRMNPPVWKLVWDYIEDLEAIRGAADGSSVTRRIEQAAGPTKDTSPESATPTAGTKRGRPSPMKKPNILPPRKEITVKQEETPFVSAAESPQPKRQRTDPGLANPLRGLSSPPTSVMKTPTSAITRTRSATEQFAQPPPRLADFAAPQYPSISAHTTAAPNTAATGSGGSMSETVPPGWGNNALKKKKPAKTSTPTPPGTASPTIEHSRIFSATAVPNALSPAGQTSFTTSAAAPVFPSLSHMQNSYPVPVATMATMAPSAPSPLLAPTAPMQHLALPHMIPNGPTRPTVAPMTRTHLRTGRGAFAPQHTEQQWSGEYHSVTSPGRPAPSAPASSSAQTTQKPRQGPSQYDGAIDLTGNDEQERQSVLSMFQSKAVPSREAAAERKGSASGLAPRTSSERASVFNEDSRDQKMPYRGTNPYERYKNQGSKYSHLPE